MSIYRLYIDESGTHDYSGFDEIKHRYLCLMGVIMSKDENEMNFTPKWNNLRKLLSDDCDFPIYFHYSDIIGMLSKKDLSFQESFNKEYLNLIRDSNYTLLCVVLDKKTHKEKYGQQAQHPYHYCLDLILERYVHFLSDEDGTGDIVAEARGKKEDLLLEREFSRFYQHGTIYLDTKKIQTCITSKKLKFATKKERICPLEFCDMLATPMKHFTLHEFNVIEKLDENFSKKVLELCAEKIRRHGSGKYKGFGIKYTQ